LKWRFHGGEDAQIHNQVGFQSSPAVVNGVVYTGCRDAHVYALDAATGDKKWEFDNAGSWVNSTPAVAAGKVIFATSDSHLFHIVDAATGKSLVKQDVKAYVFGSPAVANGVVYLDVLNGTLEARSLATGELLWDYRTQAARDNRNWALTAEGSFNAGMIFTTNGREAMIASLAVQNSVGSFYSSPMVAQEYTLRRDPDRSSDVHRSRGSAEGDRPRGMLDPGVPSIEGRSYHSITRRVDRLGRLFGHLFGHYGQSLALPPRLCFTYFMEFQP
jgi:hypothetical protein